MIEAGDGSAAAAPAPAAALSAGSGARSRLAAAAPAKREAELAAEDDELRRSPCHRPCAASCWNMGVDPRSIKGTGKDGRLTKDDVLAAAKTAANAARIAAPRRRCRRAGRPLPAPASAREERVRMTRLRQTIASRLEGSAEHRRAC